MASLIENYAALVQTDPEDLYQTAYGGFNEEEDDNDFDEGMEEADDELDSDFDVDETQEPVEEAEDEEPKAKRAKRTAKMAYEVAASRRAQKEKTDKTVKSPTKTDESRSRPSRTRPVVVKTESAIIAEDFLSKRSLRVRKPVAVYEEEEGPSPKRKRPSRKKDKEDANRVWTQEELLEEAKETERENLASLKKYELLELERSEAKKKAKRNTRQMPSSFIRFSSMTMPDVEGQQKDPNMITFGGKKSERTIISFSDEAAFLSAFPQMDRNKSPVRKRSTDIKRGTAVCPISNMRARYFDPVTQMPYATSSTFKTLREAYTKQVFKIFSDKLVSVADGSEPTKQDIELQTWLDWKRKEL